MEKYSFCNGFSVWKNAIKKLDFLQLIQVKDFLCQLLDKLMCQKIWLSNYLDIRKETEVFL